MNSLSLAWNSDRGSTEGSARGVSTLREYADLASIVLVSSRGKTWATTVLCATKTIERGCGRRVKTRSIETA